MLYLIGRVDDHQCMATSNFVDRAVNTATRRLAATVVNSSYTPKHVSKTSRFEGTKVGSVHDDVLSDQIWQNLKRFGQYVESLFSIWHTFEPTLTNLVCH